MIDKQLEEQLFRFYLMAAGVLVFREPNAQDDVEEAEPPLIEIPGRPLSETVIEERR